MSNETGTGRIICLGLTPAIQRTMVFNAFTLDAVNRARETFESAAGKSVNVARVLRSLGDSCLAIGLRGGDTGKNLLRHLDEAGVPHDFVEIRVRTRVCTTVIDREAWRVTELVEESRDVGEVALKELIARLESHLPRAAMLVLSGSLTPGAPTNFYERCASMACEARVPVIVDASGPSLQKALEAGVLLVKPNRAELATTVGPAETDDALRAGMLKLIGMGAANVVVTMGSDGAAATDGKRFWKTRPVSIDVVNPIGSGDSFTAGIASSLSRGETLPNAIRLGAACALANVGTLLSAQVTPADVDRLHPAVKLEAW